MPVLKIPNERNLVLVGAAAVPLERSILLSPRTNNMKTLLPKKVALVLGTGSQLSVALSYVFIEELLVGLWSKPCATEPPVIWVPKPGTGFGTHIAGGNLFVQCSIALRK